MLGKLPNALVNREKLKIWRKKGPWGTFRVSKLQGACGRARDCASIRQAVICADAHRHIIKGSVTHHGLAFPHGHRKDKMPRNSGPLCRPQAVRRKQSQHRAAGEIPFVIDWIGFFIGLRTPNSIIFLVNVPSVIILRVNQAGWLGRWQRLRADTYV